MKTVHVPAAGLTLRAALARGDAVALCEHARLIAARFGYRPRGARLVVAKIPMCWRLFDGVQLIRAKGSRRCRAGLVVALPEGEAPCDVPSGAVIVYRRLFAHDLSCHSACGLDLLCVPAEAVEAALGLGSEAIGPPRTELSDSPTEPASGSGERKMTLRSIWKGYLRFSMVTIPIRLYNAVDSGATIRFNQLHTADHGRVGYDKTCKSCGHTLRAEDVVKGYEYAPDEYVIVTQDDLKTLRLKSTRVLEIEGFVEADQVHQTLFDTPYFAGPDGEVAGKGYALLTEALTSSGKMGVGKIVMRDREDMVLVGPHESGLMLYKVRYPQVIRDIGEVPDLGQDDVEAQELQLARQVIDVMSTSLGQIELKDTYHEAVKELIAAKVAGKEVVSVAEEVRPVIDIMAALRDSIAQAKQAKKGVTNATARKPKTPASKTAAVKTTPKKALPKREAA